MFILGEVSVSLHRTMKSARGSIQWDNGDDSLCNVNLPHRKPTECPLTSLRGTSNQSPLTQLYLEPSAGSSSVCSCQWRTITMERDRSIPHIGAVRRRVILYMKTPHRNNKCQNALKDRVNEARVKFSFNIHLWNILIAQMLIRLESKHKYICKYSTRIPTTYRFGNRT